MNPTVSETLKVEEIITSFLYEKFSTRLKIDQKICNLQLPDLIQKLEETYDIHIDKFEVLYVTVHDLATIVQRVMNDRLHLQIVDAIDDVVSIDVVSITPLTRFVEDLCIDSISMTKIGLSLEDKFNVVIPDRKLHSFRIFALLEHFIRSQIAAKQ